MFFEQIPNTCSMLELSSINLLNDDIKDSKHFIDAIIDFNNKKYNDCNRTKTVIYNCTDLEIKNKLEKIGFQKIYEYLGNEGSTVYVMLFEKAAHI